jgi:hypothetical protein
MKPVDAQSEARRRVTNDWQENTLRRTMPLALTIARFLRGQPKLIELPTGQASFSAPLASNHIQPTCRGSIAT